MGDKSSLTFHLFAYWHDPQWKGMVGPTVKIWDLGESLTRLGHHVVVFLPKCGLGSKGQPFKVVEVPLLDLPLMHTLSYSINLSLFLAFLHLRPEPDVVYARRGVSLIPLFYAKVKKAILIYEVNDDPYGFAGCSPIVAMRSLLSVHTDEFYLRKCDIGTVITEQIMRKICQRNASISQGKLLLNPSGSNLSLIKPLDRSECRSALGLDPSLRYIGFIGSLLRHQGIETLIHAAPRILEHHPRTRFLIIGEGPLKRQWTEESQETGVGYAFLFTGQIAYESIALYLGATDVCVAPYTNSAGLRSPVKIFDYLAAGRPVVASFLTGTTDFFAESGGVQLIPPENPEALAGEIIILLSDANRAHEMGHKGRRYVEGRFDRAQLAEKISDTARTFLHKKHSRKRLHQP